MSLPGHMIQRPATIAFLSINFVSCTVKINVLRALRVQHTVLTTLPHIMATTIKKLNTAFCKTTLEKKLWAGQMAQ